MDAEEAFGDQLDLQNYQLAVEEFFKRRSKHKSGMSPLINIQSDDPFIKEFNTARQKMSPSSRTIASDMEETSSRLEMALIIEESRALTRAVSIMPGRTDVVTALQGAIKASPKKGITLDILRTSFLRTKPSIVSPWKKRLIRQYLKKAEYNAGLLRRILKNWKVLQSNLIKASAFQVEMEPEGTGGLGRDKGKRDDRWDKLIEGITRTPTREAPSRIELEQYHDLERVLGLTTMTYAESRVGSLINSHISRALVGNLQIFNKVERKKLPVSLIFALDMSGSMNGVWPTAQSIMATVAHAFHRAGAACGAVGFSVTPGGVRHAVFKTLQEPFVLGRFNGGAHGSGNSDSPTIEWARRELLEWDAVTGINHKKGLVVFSDEEPCGAYYLRPPIEEGTRLVKQALSRCYGSGIKALSVIIEDGRHTQSLYHNMIQTKEPSQIIERIATLLD